MLKLKVKIKNNLNLFLALLLAHSGIQYLLITESSADDDLQTKINFKFNEECFKAIRPNAAQAGVDKKTASYNPKCDHEWALKNGNDILRTYQIYIENLYENHVAPNKDSLSDLQASGVCLEIENLDQCQERMRREVLAAQVETRNAMLKNNSARLEIATQNRPTLVGDDSSSKNPNGSVLNDLYRASENEKKKKKAFEWIMAPQSVEFTGTQKELNNINLKKIKNEKVTDVNIQKRMGIEDPKNPTIEVSDVKENDEMNSNLSKLLNPEKNKNQNFSLEKYKKDTSNINEDIKLKLKNKKNIKGKISVTAFTESMDRIDSAVKEKNKSQNGRNPSGLSDLSLETQHLNEQLGNMDQQINGEVKLLNNNIKNEDPFLKDFSVNGSSAAEVK